MQTREPSRTAAVSLLSGEGRTITTTTETRLGTDTLPLVLLAALAHPQRAVRLRLLTRLDNAIEEGRPLHTESEVRALLARRTARADEPFALDPLAREIAVRLLRLTFARRNPHAARRWVFLGAGHKESDGGLTVTPQLQALYLGRWTQGEGRSRHGDPRLLQGALACCLRRLQTPGGLVRAVCRVDDGLHLALTGRLPWVPGAGQTLDGLDGWLGAHRRLADLGLKVELARREFRLRPTTPEATIRLSAALACGECLALWARAGANRGRLFVELHDFDGDEIELPVLACFPRGEKWLRGTPSLHLELEEEDAITLAAWAYLPEDWLERFWDWRDEDVLDRVFDARDALTDLVTRRALPSSA